jgi:uncharacterized protein (DUF58 family)
MELKALNKPISLTKPNMRPTAYGWMVVFLLFWIPLTAVFTANNFLLIVFIMMIGLVVVSHKLAKRNVESVVVKRRLPDEVHAQTPFSINYRIKTDQKLWGAMTLSFREGPPLQGEGQGVTFSRIPADKTVDAHGYFTLPRRGDCTIPAGTLSSSFPFGLAGYSRKCGDNDSVLVFPQIQPVEEDIPIDLGGFGRGLEKADPFGTVPYLFRDYVPGDPYKRIDWKKTAQSGGLVTKILSEEGAREITLRLPLHASERAISRAASLVVHFAQSGTPVSLQGPGLRIQAGRGKEFSRRLLTILARWPKMLESDATEDYNNGIIVDIDDSGDFLWTQGGDTDEPELKKIG